MQTAVCVCVYWQFLPEILEPEWVPSFICTERPIQNALKATDFRVLILDLAKFMLYKTAPSVVQGKRGVLRDLKHKQLCVAGNSHCALPCLAYGDAPGLCEHEDVNE